jgi:hypothetical protein
MADTATRPPANESMYPGVQQLMSTAWLAYFTSVANRLTAGEARLAACETRLASIEARLVAAGIP